MRALVVLAAVSMASAANAETLVAVAPAIQTGMVIVPSDWAAAGDPRLRRLAWRLTLRGVDAALASDLARPSATAQERFGKGRRALSRARQDLDAERQSDAAAAYDRALPILEANATRAGELKLVVEAMVERGALALALGDSATAEAIFLRALALAPRLDPSSARVSVEAQKLFRTVRDIVSGRPKGKLRIEPGPLTGTNVSVDFGPPLAPPYEASVPSGTHYVTVSAPDRSLVIARVTIRANEEVTAYVRPPPLGDVTARTRTLRQFRANAQESRARLIEVAGMRFMILASVTREDIRLELFETNGHEVIGSAQEIAPNPSDAELDRAIDRLLESGATFEPSLKVEVDDGPAWYATWWGAGLIGVAILGAAAGTVAAVLTPGETEYVFQPPR